MMTTLFNQNQTIQPMPQPVWAATEQNGEMHSTPTPIQNAVNVRPIESHEELALDASQEQEARSQSYSSLGSHQHYESQEDNANAAQDPVASVGVIYFYQN